MLEDELLGFELFLFISYWESEAHMQTEEFAKVRKVGHVIRELNRRFKGGLFKAGAEDGLDEVTLMHGWIMGYLHQHENQDVFQKNLESEFGIRRSSVTSLVQMMEKKGYISREAVPGDARLKKIQLTEDGKNTAIRMKHTLDGMEEQMLDGIDDASLNTFFEVADKIRVNLDQYCR